MIIVWTVNVHGKSTRPRKPVAVTMKAIAGQVGVSYQTVSRAIKGYPEISPESRTKVQHIAERIGFRTNRLAGSMRTSQPNVLSLSRRGGGRLEATATRNGYSIVLANSGQDIARERRAVTSRCERRIDGLILAPAEADHDYLRSALPKGFSIVAINRKIEWARCGAVLTENEKGARDAVEYVISRGHEKIGAIVASAGLMTSRVRLCLSGSDERFSGSGDRYRIAGAMRVASNRKRSSAGCAAAAAKILSVRDRPTASLTSSHRISQGCFSNSRTVSCAMGPTWRS